MIRGTGAPRVQLSGCGLNLLTDGELTKLHEATLDVLQDGGLMVLNDEAQEIFYSHGCKVDKKTNIVKIPSYLVEKTIRSAPSEVLLAGRNPKNDVVLGGTRVTFTNFAIAPKIIDLETGKVRQTTSKDLVECTILCDAADSVDVFSGPAVAPMDVPSQIEDLYSAEVGFANTSKHFFHIETLSTKSAKRLFEMGTAIAGSAGELRRRPLCSVAVCPVSPMQLSTEVCEVIIEAARFGIPYAIGPEAMAGATSPITLAGTIIVNNAEELGSIVLGQLTKKGTPVTYGSFAGIFDLKVVNSPFGAPEVGLISAAAAKLAQYYKLPSFGLGMYGKDSKLPDAQAAHEGTMTTLLPALARLNMIYGMGILESALTWSHEQLMIDNDIVKMIKRVIQGIDVTDETMAVDIIKQAHKIKSFLRQKHTLQHMREQSRPTLIDRTTRSTWEARGSKDLTQRAREEARRILKTHQPEPLSNDVKKTLREIVESAEKELVPG